MVLLTVCQFMFNFFGIVNRLTVYAYKLRGGY